MVRIREATASDATFLTRMLAVAADWRPDEPVRSTAEILRVPELAHYVAGWPRPGDAGVVGETGGGRRVGAAWWRLFPADEPGYGYVQADVPELAIGVAASYRGRGIGSLLLSGLVQRAGDAGLPGLSLSVEPDNPAVRLYESCGFVRTGGSGGSVTMLLRLGT